MKEEEEKLLSKFHDDIGDLVFEASKKLSAPEIILELELIKALLEVNYVNQVMGNVQYKPKRENFDMGYG